jgi:hypothetical protein
MFPNTTNHQYQHLIYRYIYSHSLSLALAMFTILDIIDFVSKDDNVATRFTLDILSQHIELMKTERNRIIEPCMEYVAYVNRAIEEIKVMKYLVKNTLTMTSEVLKRLASASISENPVDNVENYIYTLLSLGESIPDNTPPSILHKWNVSYQLPEYSPYLERAVPLDPITRRSIRPMRLDWGDDVVMSHDNYYDTE